MEFLYAFQEDPYLFGMLLVLVGLGFNGRNNYTEAETETE